MRLAFSAGQANRELVYEMALSHAIAATNELTDRHGVTYETTKLQGKSPSAKGGSVQRLVCA